MVQAGPADVEVMIIVYRKDSVEQTNAIRLNRNTEGF
jgi:hypothetical protein